MSGLILSHHLAIVSEPVFVVHFIHGHAGRLCCDVAHLVAFFGFIVHGASAFIAVADFALAIGVEEDAKTGDADSAEDAENVALVLIELGWGFAAKDEEVVAQEGLHAGQAEVSEAWAVVEECVNALLRLAQVIAFGVGWYIHTARVRLVQ
jgi:hypothetical protein